MAVPESLKNPQIIIIMCVVSIVVLSIITGVAIVPKNVILKNGEPMTGDSNIGFPAIEGTTWIKTEDTKTYREATLEDLATWGLTYNGSDWESWAISMGINPDNYKGEIVNG